MVGELPETYIFEYIQVLSGTRISATTTVGLQNQGRIIEKSTAGEGPVDTAYKAIDLITNLPLKLVDYNIKSVTEGKDAIGEVTIKVQNGAHLVTGYGASTDVIEASARAYVDVVNKVIYQNNR